MTEKRINKKEEKNINVEISQSDQQKSDHRHSGDDDSRIHFWHHISGSVSEKPGRRLNPSLLSRMFQKKKTVLLVEVIPEKLGFVRHSPSRL